MKEPWFWRSHSTAANLAKIFCLPASFFYDAGQRARAAFANPPKVQSPVICVGNATVGGVGKTPLARTLHRLLTDQGVDAHFQTRGFGGALSGPTQVNASKHNAEMVGDEPLLLAQQGPVWVSKNRARGVAAAADAGAEAIITDDGFQNPTVHKSFSILVVGGRDEFGNRAIFPAGPFAGTA